MNDQNERYFPHHVLEKDIGLAEYQLAGQKVNSDDKSITWATNATAIIATASGFAAFNLSEYSNQLDNAGVELNFFRNLFLGAIIIFSLMAIIHISYILKSLVFAERKIIVIRRMLGVSYGQNTLILPNWRIEGADDPFSIHLFPGSFSYRSYPVHVILLSSSFAIFLLGQDLSEFINNSLNIPEKLRLQTIIILPTLWYIVGLFTFKHQLNEANENWRLWITRLFAFIMRIKLIRNSEQGLYYIRLSNAESKRIGTDLKQAMKFAVFIEDRSFEKHRGINWRGSIRAVVNYFRSGKRSGGSSITQQFARSNFIVKLSPTIRRKFIEILLAKWIESIWPKNEILECYLSSVRFDRDVYGFHHAYKNYFDEPPTNVQPWEAFILIERLGNVRRKFLGNRVLDLLNQCVREGLLDISNATLALNYYKSQLGNHFSLVDGHISPSDALRLFLDKWQQHP